MADLDDYKNKKVLLHTYSNSCIPQLGVCTVTITHRGKPEPFRLFAIPGEGPVILGMPDGEIVEVLSVNCNTIKSCLKGKKIKQKTTQHKF